MVVLVAKVDLVAEQYPKVVLVAQVVVGIGMEASTRPTAGAVGGVATLRTQRLATVALAALVAMAGCCIMLPQSHQETNCNTSLVLVALVVLAVKHIPLEAGRVVVVVG